MNHSLPSDPQQHCCACGACDTHVWLMRTSCCWWNAGAERDGPFRPGTDWSVFSTITCVCFFDSLALLTSPSWDRTIEWYRCILCLYIRENIWVYEYLDEESVFNMIVVVCRCPCVFREVTCTCVIFQVSNFVTHWPFCEQQLGLTHVFANVFLNKENEFIFCFNKNQHTFQGFFWNRIKER